MAQYNILNPELRIIQKGANKDKKYLFASLQNAKCIWETPQTFTSFNENIVKAFEKILPIDKGGTAQQAQPIPQELSQVTGHWVDYRPLQKFYKIHLSDHDPVAPSPTNPQGRPAIKAGELVKKNNVPIQYEVLRVFCLYYIDEFNNICYLRGESPEEVGQRAFNAYCTPIPTDSTPQTVEDPIPVVTAQPQPAPQPTQPAQGQTGQQPNPQPQFIPQGQGQQFAPPY